MKPNRTTNDSDYGAWLDAKRHTNAPDGFSDQVLEQIADDETTRAGPPWSSTALWAKAAILALALAGGLGRYALLLICLFTG